MREFLKLSWFESHLRSFGYWRDFLMGFRYLIGLGWCHSDG
jgi:hypothetical protein